MMAGPHHSPNPDGDGRGQTEEALRQSQERLRLLVEGVRDYAILILDPQGRVVTWNAGAERIKGYKAEETIGRHFSRFYPPEDVAEGKPERLLHEARQRGQAEDEGWRVRKDGTRFWANVLITALQDESGALRGFAKVTRDMTDRRRFEEMLHSVIDHVIDGIITIDERGTVESFNPAAEKLFGYRASEIIGQNIKRLMPEPYHHQHDGYLHNYLATGQAKIIGMGREVLGRRKDGSVFPMDLAVSEFHVGTQRYFTGIVRDITERKRAEDQLRQIAARLSEANRRKSEFLATLAHELRNPLAPIRAGLEVIKLAKDDPDVITEVYTTMERQTHQLVTLVDDLLDISRITKDKFVLRKCQVELAEIVQCAVEASGPFIDDAKQELTVRLPENPVYMEADPNRLSQVLSNLLNNAAKYTPAGGHIWLTADQEGSDIVLSVKDTGIGIPAHMRECIFEMFSQIDRPVEKGYTGLGIGLTLVKSLVEMHGGRIEVYSGGVNQGSEFQVRLPLLIGTLTHDAQAVDSSEFSGSAEKHRVLVVDDNEAAADMLARMVGMLGHEVRRASNGRQAVDVAAEFLPEVVLMDLGMPVMNGYEAARYLRQQPWADGMMLIALTGWGQEDDKQRTKQVGFDHHLVKPAEPSELKRLLAAVGKRP